MLSKAMTTMQRTGSGFVFVHTQKHTFTTHKHAHQHRYLFTGCLITMSPLTFHFAQTTSPSDLSVFTHPSIHPPSKLHPRAAKQVTSASVSTFTHFICQCTSLYHPCSAISPNHLRGGEIFVHHLLRCIVSVALFFFGIGTLHHTFHSHVKVCFCLCFLSHTPCTPCTPCQNLSKNPEKSVEDLKKNILKNRISISIFFSVEFRRRTHGVHSTVRRPPPLGSHPICFVFRTPSGIVSSLTRHPAPPFPPLFSCPPRLSVAILPVPWLLAPGASPSNAALR